MIQVGQKLYEERTKKGLTLEEVAKATKIRPSFLSAIEKGEYTKLPSSAYIQGFVKNYAEFLGLPQKEFTALFKREFNEREFLQVLPEGFAKQEDIALQRFKISQPVLIIALILLVLFGYISFQYRYAIISPPLTVLSPQEGQTIKDLTFSVSGKTDSNATIAVNDMPVTIEDDGSFTKQIRLFPGEKAIRIVAKNRVGKETAIDRHIHIAAD